MKKYNVYIVHYIRVETKHHNNIIIQKKNYNETEHYYLTTKIKRQYIIYIGSRYVVKFRIV
jgi:hypothetical protein